MDLSDRCTDGSDRTDRPTSHSPRDPCAASHLDREHRRTQVALHPGEALAQRIKQVGAAPAVVFGARASDVAGMGDDRHQAGSRPQRSRARPKIARASAEDQAMADTRGAPKSVPEKNAWKKIAAKAM